MNPADKDLKFNVSEIFISLQGEGTRIGLPCIFIRFQGCELRCSWCDTPYALDIKQIGKEMSFDDIIQSVGLYGVKLVNITGGEPLIQKGIIQLVDRLIFLGYEVLIETNGHQDISQLNPEACIIMDLKCPSSKMSSFNRYQNINFLKKSDELKFIIADYEDYQWAKVKIENYNLNQITNNIIFSPVFNSVNLEQFADWIISDKLNVRMQVQLHKVIWGAEKRGV